MMNTMSRVLAGLCGGVFLAMAASLIGFIAILNAGYVPNPLFAALPLTIISGMIVMARRAESPAAAWRFCLVSAGAGVLVTPVLYMLSYALFGAVGGMAGFIGMVMMSVIAVLLGGALIAVGFMLGRSAPATSV